ncbi:MAG: FAD-dependent oxidoreductase, partial [Alphaproteobacteria bacterium]|nr:FAD-dependent oxidoreductase [Alphaproteobacteria bacterium]
MARVAVIGGGIVGACCAGFAQRSGHDVCLIERGDIGGGASHGNAGIMSSGGCVPTALPGVLRNVPKMLLASDSPLSIRWAYAPRLIPWLVRFVRAARPARVEEISMALHSLLSHAHAAYEEITDTATFERQIASNGLLFPFSSKAAFDGSLRAREIRAARGVKCEVVGSETLRGLEPALSRDFRTGILFREARHALDPGGLARDLAKRFVAGGGRVVKDNVEGVEEQDGRVDVTTAQERNSFDFAVIAAGAWSRRILKSRGRRIPLDTERGYHVTLPDPKVRISRPMIFPQYGIAVTPMRDGLRLSGLVEFAGLDAPPDYRKAQRMLDKAKALFPGISVTGGPFWMGHRPSMPVSMPVIGRTHARSKVLL